MGSVRCASAPIAADVSLLQNKLRHNNLVLDILTKHFELLHAHILLVVLKVASRHDQPGTLFAERGKQ